MSALFELNKSSDEQYRFALKAADKTLLRSEGYTEKSSAQKGIASVQQNSGSDERYEKKESSNGKYYFNLKARNGQVIGTSLMYGTEEELAAAMAATKEHGATTTIQDNS